VPSGTSSWIAENIIQRLHKRLEQRAFHVLARTRFRFGVSQCRQVQLTTPQKWTGEWFAGRGWLGTARVVLITSYRMEDGFAATVVETWEQFSGGVDTE